MEERQNRFILVPEEEMPVETVTPSSTPVVEKEEIEEQKIVEAKQEEIPEYPTQTMDAFIPPLIPSVEETSPSASLKVEDSLSQESEVESLSPLETTPQEKPLPEEKIPSTPVSKDHQSRPQENNLQNMINKILKIDRLDPVKVEQEPSRVPPVKETVEETIEDLGEEEPPKQETPSPEEGELLGEEKKKEILPSLDQLPVIFESDLLPRLEKELTPGEVSILVRYGDDFCSHHYITNPAIGRDEEIKQLILTLLTPEKSAILIGKPGIGKTSIVEGLAYRLQRGAVPDLLKGFSIVSIKTPSLLGTLPTGETRLQTLVDELKKLDKIILFIDEIHMLIGANNDSALDFANMFKESLGRGQIKVIGATTTEEYERYILRDKAFVRRFQSIEVLEPSREHTIQILMGTLPKIEQETGAKLKYTSYIQREIMGFITDITSEYKRIYGIGSRYPDICLTLLKQAFSQAMFENRKEVNIFDIRNAIENSTNIYPDVIRKELPKFDTTFQKIIAEENGTILS